MDSRSVRRQGRNSDAIAAPSSRRKRRRVADEDRKRAERACISCRKVKEKCIGNPPCQRCTRLHRECVVDPSSGPAGGQSLRRENSNDFYDMERIEMLEQIVRHFTGCSAFGKPQLSQIIDSSFRVTSQSRELEETPRSGAVARKSEVIMPHVLPSDDAVYSEELSHSSFSEYVKQKVSSNLQGPTAEVEQVIEPQFQPTKDGSEARNSRFRSSSVVDVTSSFPPQDVAYFLLDVFFDFAQTNYSYVDEKALRQKLDQFYSSSPCLTHGDESWACTALMTFAIGTQFAHLSSRSQKDASSEDCDEDDKEHSPDDNVALAFYQAATRLIPDVIATASIEGVQAFLLLGIYTLPIDAAGLSYAYFGIAIRIAVQNSMHRNHDAHLCSRSRELRKRLWWTAYTLEKRVSVLHGRPTSIAREQIDVELPLQCPDLLNASRIDTLPNILAMIKLTAFLEDARDQITILRRAKRTQKSLTPSSLLDIKQQLEKYWHSLPDQVYGRDLTPDGPLFRFNIHLAMTYHLIHIFIGRAFIFDSSGASTPESASSARLGSAWPQARNALVSRCISSAMTITELCQTLHDEVGLSRASYTEFTSCHAALVAILAQRTCAGSARLSNACKSGMHLLKQMSVGIYAATAEKLAIQALEAAVRKLDQDNGSGRKGQTELESTRSAYEKFRNWAVLWKADGAAASVSDHVPYDSGTSSTRTVGSEEAFQHPAWPASDTGLEQLGDFDFEQTNAGLPDEWMADGL